MTLRIRDAVQAGAFQDNARMEHFDVVFANRYLEAYYQFQAQQPTRQCWAVPFRHAQQRLLLLQHLFMGMNAHISFDLGLTAAQMASGSLSEDLRADFDQVNDILEAMINEMQRRVNKASPLLFLLDWIGGRGDEWVANFSLRSSRAMAWELAVAIAPLEGEAREAVIDQFDAKVARLNTLIAAPPGRLLGFGLRLIRRFEPRAIAKIVERLKAPFLVPPKSMA